VLDRHGATRGQIKMVGDREDAISFGISSARKGGTQNFGLLLSGIGGGSLELPANSFFFGGGGGASFLPAAPGPAVVGDCGDDAVLSEAKLLTLPAMPYFWFSPFAALNPDATCAPCRCWKLFAVDAAFFISVVDTFDGSSRRPLAVRSAACLSTHDVPVVGAVLVDPPADIFENLLCNSPSCEPRPVVVVAGGAAEGGTAEAEFCRGGTGGELVCLGGTGGEAVRPTPNPGTETPACPSRFNAP
jgi:hypothetical protein